MKGPRGYCRLSIGEEWTWLLKLRYHLAFRVECPNISEPASRLGALLVDDLVQLEADYLKWAHWWVSESQPHSDFII